MNAYGPSQQGPPHGWPQQPPMSQPGFNGNPPQNLVSQVSNMNLNDVHGPPKPGQPLPPTGSMGQQKFMPPPQQGGPLPATNGLQNQASSGSNNNLNDNQLRMPPPSTTPVQNGQGQHFSNGPAPLLASNPFSEQQTDQSQSSKNQYLPPGQNLQEPMQRPPNQGPIGQPSLPPMNARPTMPPQQPGRPPSVPTESFQQQQQQQTQSAVSAAQQFPTPKMPSFPGQPQFSNQQQQQQAAFPPQHQQQQFANQQPQLNPSKPPFATQPSLPGQSPFPGQPPQLGQPPLAGQPPLPGQSHQQFSGQQQFQNRPQFPSQPPMPPQPSQFHGQPPLPGQPQLPGQPPLSGPYPGQKPPMPGQPPMLGQPPFPGQPSHPGQHHQSQSQSMMPPMPGQPPFMGQHPGQPPFPGHQPSVPPMPHQQTGGPYPPGMPPQPYAGQAPGYNQTGGHYPQQEQTQRRLDPDQMPNPIEVMNDNQIATTSPFVTSQPGLVPPLVTTKYVTHDQGNSSPRFIRSSMYNVPFTADMMKQTAVPFALMLSPFARTVEGEIVPPIVDFGEMGPIRCIRCKAYMCPNMQFIDAGRRFQCLLCKVTTEVPQEYFKHLDHTGQREDKYERPELVLGTYEFVATKDYCRNNVPPSPPAMIFVIDVSYNNIKSGLVHLLCAQMKEIIKNLPIDQGHDRSYMKVGFITYNNVVHFYNIKSTLAQPQMMVVGDVGEMFMPLLDGFLCDPEESGAVIDSLMEQIPAMFGETRETETVLLPAIQAGMEALKASGCAGKLLVFHSSLPVSEAPGKLRNRDDRNVLGTEKEKTVLAPQNTNYNNLGQECIQVGCAVDLFLFNNSYIDIATIGQVSRLTGGEVYKYTYFQADVDGHRLISDIVKNISRPIAFDAVMRVRTSAGVRPTDFYGHFFMSNTTDMEISAIDCDKSIAIEIKHDDKLSPDENVYIQTALLYTSCSGQRRLRVLNLALKICTQMTDLFRYCDLDVIILYFAKQMIFKLMEQTPRAVKESLENRCAQILACYRKNCASPTSSGQLILPECMKLLPLYASCLIKNDAISGSSDMTCDDRSYVMQFVLSMNLPMSVAYFYPRLIPIHTVNPNDTNIPNPIRCTIEKMMDDGAYILENGVNMFVWLGLAVAPEFTQSVFGVPSVHQIDTERCGIPALDNPLSERVRNIIDQIQAERPRCMRVIIIRQRDKLENVLKHYLIEDRGSHGAPSYVDYLCHLHKEIRALLS